MATIPLIKTTDRNVKPGQGYANNIIVKSGDINSAITQLNTNTTDIATLQGYDTASNPSPSIINREISAVVTIGPTQIVGTAAEDLGHANGATLVAAPGAGYALEFISALVIYDFDTAAYTGGGNDTSIRLGGGGAAITGVVTSANLLGAAGDKIVRFDPLSTAALPVTANVGISLTSTTAWTQPGTAAGVLRVHITYRVHATEL